MFGDTVALVIVQSLDKGIFGSSTYEVCTWSVHELPVWIQFLVDFDPDWIWPCQLVWLV